MATIIPVEMGETKVSSRRTDRFLAIGLGACVGICFYDPIALIAAMIHVVLPRTPIAPPAVQTKNPLPQLPGKCADTALPYALAELERAGAVPSRLRVAIVGGAQISTPVPSAGKPGSPAMGSRLEIGPRNIEAVKIGLSKARIPLVAEQTGGHCGRTVTFDVATGQVLVRAIGAEERLLVCLADRYTDHKGKAGALRG